VSRYGQWTLTVSDRVVATGGGRPVVPLVTDAAFGVRSNSLCSGPKRPSANDVSWCGSMPVLMTRYGTIRATRARNVAGVSSSS
jgi:hypothetical protein